MSDTELLTRLARMARRARLRVRLRGTLQAITASLPALLIYLLAALTLIKLFHARPELEDILVWGALIPTSIVLVLVLRATLKKLHPLAGARALDQHYKLADRVSNAIAFGQVPKGDRTALMQAAIEDARAVVSTLKPAQATPLLANPRRQLKDILVSVLLGGCVYGISLLEIRTTREVVPPVSSFQPTVLPQDDVDLLRDWAKELDEKTEDPEARAAVQEFNRLVEDIADRRLERKDIFKRLEELDSKLADPGALEGEEIEESLRNLADELKKSKLSKPVAEALEKKDLPDAEKAMRELAKKLKEKPRKVNRAELDRLRKALEKAGKSSQGRLQRLEAQRQRLEQGRRRLLNKKNKNGGKLSKSEQRQLDKHERQLKRLDRQKKRAQEALKELSQLDKELAKAAEALRKELGEEAAKSLEQGAQDLNRMAKRQLSQKEKENLKKQLEQLRQLLRQHKKGSKKRKELLEQFRKRARGNGGKPGGKKGQGQGPGKKPGQLSLGQGTGVPIPVPGQGAGQGQGQGSEPSSSWGSGSDDNLKGDKTDLKGQVQDVAAAGIDSGEGEASSETVYTAAERGFSGTDYKKVYTDYKTVAEEVMEQDEIPPGYKFYVRRYFQLIRPRQ